MSPIGLARKLRKVVQAGSDSANEPAFAATARRVANRLLSAGRIH